VAGFSVVFPYAGRCLAVANRDQQRIEYVWARDPRRDPSDSSSDALSRLSRAKEFGAWETVNPRSNDPIGAIKDLTHGGADFTLDTSSQPEGRIAAVRSAKVWGTVCFVGERNNVTIDVSPDMLRKQLTIIASWTFSSIGQAECAQFIVDRKVDVEGLFDTQTTGKGVFLM